MPSRDQVAAGKAIQRGTGPTFYLATRFLPERVRHGTYVLYGFFRIADEVVDSGDPSPATQRKRLSELRTHVLEGHPPENGHSTPSSDGSTGELLDAVSELSHEEDIPTAELELFLDAMEQDIDTARYETMAALDQYMRGSAAAVATMMTAIMTQEEPETAIPHAQSLGEAFQLSNFLRDVREDVVERDRIYLPREILNRHGVTVGDIEALEMSASFRAAMRELLRRTERRYRHGVAGIRHLPEDCQFPVLLSAVLYADHHRLIRARELDVLSETPTLSTPRKLWLLARTAWRWYRCGDPETTFFSVSEVAREGPSVVEQPPVGSPTG